MLVGADVHKLLMLSRYLIVRSFEVDPWMGWHKALMRKMAKNIFIQWTSLIYLNGYYVLAERSELSCPIEWGDNSSYLFDLGVSWQAQCSSIIFYKKCSIIYGNFLHGHWWKKNNRPEQHVSSWERYGRWSDNYSIFVFLASWVWIEKQANKIYLETYQELYI